MKIRELDEREWFRWVRSRPEVIQAMCESHPLDRLYCVQGGRRGTIYSYSEDGTMTVDIEQRWNPEFPLLFERQVFGLKPEDLVECDMPRSSLPTA